MKTRKAGSRTGARSSGSRKPAAGRTARARRSRSGASLASTPAAKKAPARSAVINAHRAAIIRLALKRSSPHPAEANRGAASVVATLDQVRGSNGRALPRFPEDDYDYGYLHEFLALDYVPGDCRAVIFGCGKGEEAVHLSERGYRVTGLDSDRNAIGLARERAWLNGRDIDFMIGDVFESANLLPAESFGLATDRGVFRAIQGERERRRYLELIRRLLLPGGVFLLTATEVDLSRKVKTAKRRKRRGQDDLMVQEGGEVMGEVLRAGLTISGRKHYPLPNGNGKADLLLYCRR